ncbi:prepilin peptidase [Silvimonas iriomotensis]|uniref:Prepilin leader peptidase/N-methyltransferase n=1 Tax=Silvimonas iriomotensis TaxID=449662 RepID=A0ABQ2PAA4_9NEIS|nr:A24 family peptidase [Silvimonas iriomotensis]GGP21473.1 type 4 prepilin-like proteins leader peptide-processing enzyme [Silvimonas iriomotensis]
MHDYALLFSQNPLLFGGFCLLLGLLVGSFLNVVIHRLPRMIEAQFRLECAALDLPPEEPLPQPETRYNLVVPRSACPTCGHQISALENIPVLSWLALGGKCRGCRSPISIRYPAVELLTGLMTAFTGMHLGFGLHAIAAIVITWALIALFFIDADTYLLPDSITLPLMWAGMLFNLGDQGFTSLSSSVIGAAAGYLVLWSVFWLFKLATGKEGMGYGDFKLLAALGAWFGWQSLPVIVLLSSVAGALIGMTMVMAAKRGFGKPMPFGPYLALAGWGMLIWGPQLQALLFGNLLF